MASSLVTRFAVILLSIGSLAGCVVIEPIDLQPNERIGVYIDVSDELNIGYMGFLVFGNQFDPLEADVDRFDDIADHLMASAGPNMELIERDLEMTNGLDDLRAAAGRLGYDYVLYVHDGSICLDGNCNRIFYGSGIYGNSVIGRRFVSSIDYTLLNTRMDARHYGRDLWTWFKIHRQGDGNKLKNRRDPVVEENPKIEELSISESLRCLDLRNVTTAMLQINETVPLFDVSPAVMDLENPKARAFEHEDCAIPI